MSATNRGAVRNPSDYYPTPEWCTEALFKYLPGIGSLPVIDPCAGDGAILRVAERHGAKTIGVELRPECAPDPGSALAGYRRWVTADALDPATIERFNAEPIANIVTNPPYSLAQEFIEAWRPVARWSFWLLRLNFLGSQKRAAWFRDWPPSHVLILPKRPSFTGGKADACEYAWIGWGPRHPGGQVVEWLEVGR